ncbi:MAG: CPBP family intramembrane metalloprotease [Phycisphaerales bacterium]|nr:MAG: CPBP family intramembrane metalloprotease [Phycisphaerales bacterium]
MILGYLKKNLLRGFRISPFRIPLRGLIPVPIYIGASLAVGFAAGLFSPGVVDSPLLFVLPFSLFIFPCLLEEAFFRGVLIPNDAASRSKGKIIAYIVLSTMAFVLWHPANALTINPPAAPLFLNPAFLLIVAFLGITCSISYIVSRSLWVPIIIHWLTVVVWVIFLGGRNKLLEL